MQNNSFFTVVVTFNSEKSVVNCLNRIFEGNPEYPEVIVVDNGSKDNTVSSIKNTPGIRIIENENNLGACRARNQGIGASLGEWVLVLDSDVVLEKDFLSKSLELLKKLSPEVGIIQPKVMRSDNKTIYSCGIHLSYLMRFYDIGMNKKDAGAFDKPAYVFGACSAAAFYRRKMLDEIKESTGYFDERFFFLVEDVDLSWRASKRGWKALFTPELVCSHDGNSSNSSRELRQYLCFRNRIFTIIKNEKSFIRMALSLFVYDIPRLAYLIFVNKLTFKALKEISNFRRGAK